MMTDYLADKRTVTKKRHKSPHAKIGSNGEVSNEKEINFLDYSESWELLNKNEVHPNKQKFTKPLSDLGKALSETISKLTRDKRFKCGDKVELILEIELVNSDTNHNINKVEPKHSIVEVTIIQHRVPEEESVTKPMKGDGPRTVPYRLLSCNSESETASTKRRKWFERVVYNQTVRNDPPNYCRNFATMHGDNNTRYSTIKYLNTKWCEPNVETENVNCGNVSKERPQRKFRNKATLFQNEQLGMGFLPASKANKSKEVEKAFSELKEKVGNIIQNDNLQNTNTMRKKRGPIPALGKLVSNILVGVIDKVNSMNSIMEMPTNNVRQDGINQKFCRITNEGSMKHDKVTQILKPRYLRDESTDELNISPRAETNILKQNNQYDCGFTFNNSDRINVTKQHVTDGKNNSAKIKKKEQIIYKRISPEKYVQHKVETNVTGTSSSDQSWILKIEKKKKHKPKDENIEVKTNQNVSLNNKSKKTKDTQNWLFDGKSLKLGSELKKKIEMLIVNELQNLALKEGMECDISPLSASSENILNKDLKNSISEVQSFICEVDLTDNATEKLKGNIIRINDANKCKDIYSEEVKTDEGERHREHESKNVDDRKLKLNKINNEMEEKKFEVTYFNPAIKSSSKDSEIDSDYIETCRTFVLNSPKVIEKKEVPNSKKGFVKQLESDDTIWKNTKFVEESVSNSSQQITESGPSKTSTSNENQISDTTNEYCSNIEIELDVKGLENILEQARANGFSDKFLINATRNKKKKNKHKSRTVNKSKNTSSYTETVLSEAAKKLQHHLKRKDKKKHAKK